MQKQDQNRKRNAALIVAGGSGVRAGLAQGRPKQYCSIGGEAVLRRTVCAFLEHPQIDHVIVALRVGDEALYEEALAGLSSPKLLRPVPGGATRQLSVKAGLDGLEALAPDAVLIHDAARPFISAACISGTIAALELFDGAIAAAPVTDTLKRGEGGAIAGTVSREGLWRAQTPQTFHYQKILDAHRAAVEAGRTDFTDDAVIAEWAGLTVGLVENAAENMKITTAGDLAMADLIAGGGSGRTCAAGPGSMCMRSARAITSRSAASRFRTATGSWRIPMATPRCMRSPTRCSAPSALATSATTSRPPIRNGAAWIRRYSSFTR